MKSCHWTHRDVETFLTRRSGSSRLKDVTLFIIIERGIRIPKRDWLYLNAGKSHAYSSYRIYVSSYGIKLIATSPTTICHSAVMKRSPLSSSTLPLSAHWPPPALEEKKKQKGKH